MAGADIEGTRRTCMVVVGHARLPQSLCPPEGSTIIIELEVGREDGLITGVNLSCPLPSAGRLLASLLVGRSMETEYGQALLEFQRSYIGPLQKAICTALNAAQESYRRRFRRVQLEPVFSSRLDRRGPADPEFRWLRPSLSARVSTAHLRRPSGFFQSHSLAPSPNLFGNRGLLPSM